MENKEKKWESGPNQPNFDERLQEQVERALKENERRKDNLDDKGHGPNLDDKPRPRGKEKE